MSADERLASAIVKHLTGIKAYNLPVTCSGLGLQPGDEAEAYSSKRLYVERRLAGLRPPAIRGIAEAILASTPDFFLEEAMRLSREAGRPEITEVTRRRILDTLALSDNLCGHVELTDLLRRVWPLDQMESTDGRFRNAAGDIWQHMINNNDWTLDYLFQYLELNTCSDQLFTRFLEALVHPVVRDGASQLAWVEELNEHLAPDGFALSATDSISGRPVYAASRKHGGVSGRPKNIIFAADGPKPEIVLRDAVNNDIQIVKNAQYCLVFDQPIPITGLTWDTLVKWWSLMATQQDLQHAERMLYKRLAQALTSPPEQLLFRHYFKTFRLLLKDRLPALLPQVYLHYDPMTVKQRKGPGPLTRQRMDFLLLLSPTDRIVIEVDGKQHYADGERASPSLYASMIAADRDLRLSGYEVYRFGGSELSQGKGETLVAEFFSRLLRRKGLPV